MSAVIILLALSGLIGFALGTSFTWLSIAAGGLGLAVISAAVLQIQGFGALPGVAIVVVCLTVSQMAYLAGVFSRSRSLFHKQADKEPGQRRNNNIGSERHTSLRPGNAPPTC